ncbi:hypothetical protein [Neisseria weaveri]|uniref:hypothetical protein n=2 Tax=Neisseria weaveri TaxID=28091 RepID=UPI000D3124A0|nr:hypothetical protein [Neisseria weaveri]
MDKDLLSVILSSIGVSALVGGGLACLIGDIDKSGLDSTIVIISLISLSLNNLLKAKPLWQDKFDNFIREYLIKKCIVGFTTVVCTSIFLFFISSHVYKIEFLPWFFQFNLLLASIFIVLYIISGKNGSLNINFIYFFWWAFLAIVYILKIKNINLFNYLGFI